MTRRSGQFQLSADPDAHGGGAVADVAGFGDGKNAVRFRMGVDVFPQRTGTFCFQRTAVRVFQHQVLHGQPFSFFLQHGEGSQENS